MSKNPTIEGEIQEAILDILPDDGQRALDLIAQLTANMLLSINGANIDVYQAQLRSEYRWYQEEDKARG